VEEEKLESEIDVQLDKELDECQDKAALFLKIVN
jgi:hypothetical protein